MRLRLLIACTIVVAAACQRDAGAPSDEQKRDLDEAAQMLNDAPANLDAIDDSALIEANRSEEPR